MGNRNQGDEGDGSTKRTTSSKSCCIIRLSDMSLSADLAGDGGEHPSDVVGVGDEATSLGEPGEERVEQLLALVEGLEEAEGVVDDELELGLVEGLLAELLLDVEVAQPDLAGVLEDEGCLG
jgi:hypothetical protein